MFSLAIFDAIFSILGFIAGLAICGIIVGGCVFLCLLIIIKSYKYLKKLINQDK